MRPNTLRVVLILMLVVAAALSVLGNKLHERWLVALSFGVFLLVVLLIMRQRRARVFAREAKTHETRARTDK